MTPRWEAPEANPPQHATEFKDLIGALARSLLRQALGGLGSQCLLVLFAHADICASPRDYCLATIVRVSMPVEVLEAQRLTAVWWWLDWERWDHSRQDCVVSQA